MLAVFNNCLENNLNPLLASLTGILESKYKVDDATLTKIDLINGHHFIEPPLMKRLATTMSFFSLKAKYILSIILTFRKSSAG